MFIMNKKRILSPIAAICIVVGESALPFYKKRTFEITFTFQTPFNIYAIINYT